jgi:predicted dehydrogenase
MSVNIAMVGCGAFAQCFIPLFKAHPLVDRFWLCDTAADKLAENAKKWGVAETFDSLDAVCASKDVDAAVIITQNWMHAPQAAAAMRAGKHVYSAVPAGVSVEQISELVDTVKRTGQIYMMGETSYYHAEVVYCRGRLAAGDFGRVIYSQSEYYHDFDHGLYDVFKWRGGKEWKRYAGAPPMYYPTHSIGGILGVTDARLTNVSCLGFVDDHEDGLFRPGINDDDNIFSNQSALFSASDGSSVRINEFRRVGHPSAERISGIWGTGGSFEQNAAGAVWLTRDHEATMRLDDDLRSRYVEAQIDGGMEKIGDDAHTGLAPVHDATRLPREFIGLPNGHGGAHQFLVDDFVKACDAGKQPPVNVWRAARYTVPGIVAHESAKRDGERIEVPDFGDPPA